MEELIPRTRRWKFYDLKVDLVDPKISFTRAKNILLFPQGIQIRAEAYVTEYFYNNTQKGGNFSEIYLYSKVFIFPIFKVGASLESSIRRWAWGIIIIIKFPD